MKTRSFSALIASGILLATATLALSGCGVVVLYKTPEYTYSGRPVPPSKMLQRVLVAFSATGTSGGLEILDGLRDLRGNVQNTTKIFPISGYSEAEPVSILNFPEQTTGYVLSYNDGNLIDINYSKETAAGTVSNFAPQLHQPPPLPSALLLQEPRKPAGQLVFLNRRNHLSPESSRRNKVVINPGFSVVLAMVQNSNTLYRIVKLPATANPVLPPATWTVNRCFCLPIVSFPLPASTIARST